VFGVTLSHIFVAFCFGALPNGKLPPVSYPSIKLGFALFFIKHCCSTSAIRRAFDLVRIISLPMIVAFILIFTQYTHAAHSLESNDYGLQIDNHHCKTLCQGIDTPKDNHATPIATTIYFYLYPSKVTCLTTSQDFRVTPPLRAPPSH
jgi:hypothetical protein